MGHVTTCPLFFYNIIPLNTSPKLFILKRRTAGSSFPEILSTLQTRPCRPWQCIWCSRWFAPALTDLWQMVWRGTDRRKQKAIPNSWRICPWFPGPFWCSWILLQSQRFLASQRRRRHGLEWPRNRYPIASSRRQISRHTQCRRISTGRWHTAKS